VVLLLIAVIASVLLGGLLPHVIYRVPLALVTAFGLWKRRRWAYRLAFINAAVWVLVFLSISMFLLVAPPWELWSAWLYWLVPTGLVVAVCVLMMSTAGRTERAGWPHGG
jgi:uncharacterized membrane protein (DUF2068 family)